MQIQSIIIFSFLYQSMELRNTTNQSFTSRCPQIRDAQWVSHIVNSTFPHFSTTKHQEGIISYLENNNLCSSRPNNLGQVMDLLEQTPAINKRRPPKTALEKVEDFVRYIFLSKENKKKFKIKKHIYDKIYQLKDLRKKSFKKDSIKKDSVAMKIIKYIKNEKIGNCLEDAMLSEIVLKLNGVKNVTRIHMYNLVNGKEKVIDHSVCLINPPDVPFEKGHFHPKSIIVDAWSGKCDFAENMLKYYRNTKGKFFRVKGNKKTIYEPAKEISISNSDLEQIKNEYPQLIYPNKEHKFLNIK